MSCRQLAFKLNVTALAEAGSNLAPDRKMSVVTLKEIITLKNLRNSLRATPGIVGRNLRHPLRPIVAGMILFLLAGSEVCGQLGITIQPMPQAICAGDAASFSVVVSGGTGTLSYQWYVDGAQVINGVNISGSRSAALTFNPAFAGRSTNLKRVVSSLAW